MARALAPARENEHVLAHDIAGAHAVHANRAAGPTPVSRRAPDGRAPAARPWLQARSGQPRGSSTRRVDLVAMMRLDDLRARNLPSIAAARAIDLEEKASSALMLGAATTDTRFASESRTSPAG